jgi:hypothetical protein
MPNNVGLAPKADREPGLPTGTDKLTINRKASLKTIRVGSRPNRARRERPQYRNPIRSDAPAI